ncbi:MAG: putative 2-aminoethylphosphonate ABC transporter ATP-binding protein [Candidatus Rokubacteria bacterium]|nr:putative 2-aminoethylphosphonate ABC transporter ATP-binding protein [Candidatus Rokubacteria bacterium]
MSESAPAPAAVALEGIAKKFGAYVALRDITLSVTAGEFICFLGPSGCGKTTLLRIIAGLERQNAGTVRMAGRDVSGLPPALRNYGIVFQSYALFPNLTVGRNIAYGLETRRTGAAAIARRVDELLALVGLARHKDKYPAQLSGGEQQRVALARALAPSPALLLLDEPLSALDARVRQSLRHEIRGLQRRLGVTTVMVTHDQEEALTMADRIVVMNAGQVEQVGAPAEVYRRPRTPFVARFVGQMNFLSAVAGARSGWARVGAVELRHQPGFEAVPGGALTLAIRPEEITVGPAALHAENPLRARITAVQFLGAFTRLGLTVDGEGRTALECDVAATAFAELGVGEGADLPIALAPDALRAFPVPGPAA